METQIRIPAHEFDLRLFNRIKDWLQQRDTTEIVINIKENVTAEEDEYVLTLNQSVKELAEGKTESFTMEGLEKYMITNFS